MVRSSPKLFLRRKAQVMERLLIRYRKQANFPNLRRLFIDARSDDEEREVSRRAFYNAVLFMSSVAVFGLIAQRMNAIR
ncbi:hypothetical protein GGR50DRAFT_527507 [Xylaria sp. CBS 124048]|nr:hypothetical protein GGR50DRAFT_527507 [Xylaria sp. CBS 124048]